MPAVNILKFPTSSPADTTPLKKLQERGYEVGDILGVVGKTEGNGCVNDFSRTLSSHVWDSLIPSNSISIFSGGTEGVLSPHITFIVSEKKPTGLIGSVSRTRELLPHEIGTSVHAECVADSVKKMLDTEGLTAEDVHLVLIKCPLLTSSKIGEIAAAGREPITRDTYESMAKSRYASAIGISLALGEIDSSTADISSILSKGEHWTSKASCSSGAELEDCHILILANTRPPLPNSSPVNLRAYSTVMTSAIDYPSISKLLSAPPSGGPAPRLIQLFAKAEADPTGLIHSVPNRPLSSPNDPEKKAFRHTMTTDSDIHSTRHARAAVGGLLAGVTGDCEIYVSGGAEGQGPRGGGGVTVVVGW